MNQAVICPEGFDEVQYTGMKVYALDFMLTDQATDIG